MPPSTVSFNVNANVSQANKAIQSVHSNINRLGQPLGRITGDAAEFSKSLQAAAARVTAFGAIAGVLTGISRGISGAAKATIELNKELTELNSFLGTSRSQLDNFGKGLFDIARKTATDFKVVSEAAKEFARQGLSLEETLKRTNSALVLSRISGLGFAESVTSITTALNSFTKSALTAETITNKLIAVDVKFAVSANDLAQAISRVGSSAEEAGLNFDQLSAGVTAVQQITGRGGAVIGNSLKTIFTRVQRPEVLRQLEELGVVVRNQNGALLDAINIFKNYAAVRENLNQVERASTDELLGGVFQINQLKALTKDLASANSIYERALRISTNATDEATQKNEQLNKSFSALFSQTATNAKQVGAQLGSDLFGPLFRTAPQTINGILGVISGQDFSKAGEKAGESMAKGVVSGLTSFVARMLGSALSQALLPIATLVGGGLALRLGGFGLTAVRTGAKDLFGGAIFGKNLIRSNAGGYIPAFAKEEAQARSMGAINPKARLIKATIRGKTGPAIVNDQEDVFNIGGETAIIPRYRPLNSIPSFAMGGMGLRQSAFLRQITPDFLNKYSKDKTSILRIFKDAGYINDLKFDQKGTSRYFIPLDKEKGIKLAFNDAGLAQTKAEVDNLNNMSNMKYGSILPKLYSYDKKNYSWSIVERLKTAQSLDDPKFAKMFMKNLGKPRESFLKGKNVTDLEKRVINFAADNDLTLKDFTAGVNTGFTPLGSLKLLDTGLTRQMSMNYGGASLTPWALSKGRIPSFPAGNIPYGAGANLRNPWSSAVSAPQSLLNSQAMAAATAQSAANASQQILARQQQIAIDQAVKRSFISSLAPSIVSASLTEISRRAPNYLSPQVAENTGMATSFGTGAFLAYKQFKDTPGNIYGRVAAAALASAPAFLTGLTQFFSRGNLAKEIAVGLLQDQSDKINEAFSENIGKIQELTQVYGKLEAAYGDPSISPSALIELNKTAADLTRNLSKGSPELVAALATTTSPEERIDILSEFSRKSGRENSLKNTILGFASNTNQNTQAFTKLFTDFTNEITGDALKNIKSSDLRSQTTEEFKSTLSQLDLGEVRNFFESQGENSNKLLVAYKNYLSDWLDISEIEKTITREVIKQTLDFEKRKKELTAQKAVNAAGISALEAGLTTIGQNLGGLGGGATGSLAFNASKDIAIKTLQESKSFQNLILNSDAPDSIKNALEAVPSQGNAKILSDAINSSQFNNQELSLAQVDVLQNILVKNESSLAAIKEQIAISEKTLTVQKEIVGEINKATSFAGGIKASISAGASNESFQELLKPFLKARLGMQFGDPRAVATGRAEFLGVLSQQYPNSGIESSPEAEAARRGLQPFVQQNIRRSVFRGTGLAGMLGFGGVGTGMIGSLGGVGNIARDQIEQILPTGGTPSIANRFVERFQQESLSTLKDNKRIDAELLSLGKEVESIKQSIIDEPTKQIDNISENIKTSLENTLTDLKIDGANVNVTGEATVNISSKKANPPKKSSTITDMSFEAMGGGGIFNRGFIPSFANPLREAIGRESQYVPPSTIRVNQSNKLVNRMNPMGLAVTNTIDEPNGLASIGLASRGFIPNFAAMGESVRQKGLSALTQGKLLVWDNSDDLYYKVKPDFSVDYDQSFKQRPRGYQVIDTALVDRSKKYSILNLKTPFPSQIDNKLAELGASGKAQSFNLTDLLKKGLSPQELLNQINKMAGGHRVIAKLATGESNMQGKGVFGKSAALSLDDVRNIISHYQSTGDAVMIEKFARSVGPEFRVHAGIDADGVARIFGGATVDKVSMSATSDLSKYEKSGWVKSEAEKFINLSRKAAEEAALKQATQLASKGVRSAVFGFDISSTLYEDAVKAGIKNLDTFNYNGKNYVPHIYEFNPSEYAGSSGFLGKKYGTLGGLVRSVLEPDVARVSSEPPPLPNQSRGMSLVNKAINFGAKGVDYLKSSPKIIESLKKLGITGSGIEGIFSAYNLTQGRYLDAGLGITSAISGYKALRGSRTAHKVLAATILAKQAKRIYDAPNMQTATSLSDLFSFPDLLDAAVVGTSTESKELNLLLASLNSLYKVGNLAHQGIEGKSKSILGLAPTDGLAHLMTYFMKPKDAIPAGGFQTRGTMASIEEELKRPRRQSLAPFVQPSSRINDLFSKAKSLPVTSLSEIETDILPKEYNSLPNWLKERIRSRVRSLAHKNATDEALRNYLSRYAEVYDPVGNYHRLAKRFQEEGLKNGLYIPNYASGFRSEMSAIASSPAYAGFRDAVPQMSNYYPNVIKNSAEIEVPATEVYSRMGFPGARPKNPSEQYAILNPAQQAALGYASGGFVPNFASDEFTSTMVAALEKVFSPMLNKMSSTGSTSNVINVNDQRTYETTSDKVDGIMEFLAQQFPREIGKLGINI